MACVSCRRRREMRTAIAMTPPARAKRPAKKIITNMNMVATRLSGMAQPPLPLPFPEPLPPQLDVQPPLPGFPVTGLNAEPLEPDLSFESMLAFGDPESEGARGML